MSEVTENNPLLPDNQISRWSERKWVSLIALLTMLATLVPYMLAALQSQNRQFMWLGYNLDDSCVYLSWMRQAAEGNYRALNLFTTDPQNGMLLNPFFLILGKIAGMTGIPLLAIYHGARLVFGFLLLLAAAKFISQTVAQEIHRKTALLFVCIGSGLGWLPLWWSDPAIQTPIDKWQPEAITFLSLYLSPLFAFSLFLQVVTISCLYQAQQTRTYMPAIVAGFTAFILGLTHTYDVLSLSVVWFTYLLVQTATNKEDSAKILLWKQAAIAGIIAFPATAYIALQLKSEAVFQARANVETLSPKIIYIILGYGLLAIFGIYAAITLQKHDKLSKAHSAEFNSMTHSASATQLLIVWAIMNIVASYLPVPFQRKMLQGTHFPIAILAAIGFEMLLALRPRLSRMRVAVITVTLFVLSLTNVRFVAREMGNFTENLVQTKTQRPYLKKGELEALNWVKANTTTQDAIQPLPYVGLVEINGIRKSVMTDATVACFTPGLINRKVYWGHWGETPDYQGKIPALITFAQPRTSDDQRREILRSMKVKYLIFSQKAMDDTNADILAPMFRGRTELPPYLLKVHTNVDADVYEIRI